MVFTISTALPCRQWQQLSTICRCDTGSGCGSGTRRLVTWMLTPSRRMRRTTSRRHRASCGASTRPPTSGAAPCLCAAMWHKCDVIGPATACGISQWRMFQGSAALDALLQYLLGLQPWQSARPEPGSRRPGAVQSQQPRLGACQPGQQPPRQEQPPQEPPPPSPRRRRRRQAETHPI